MEKHNNKEKHSTNNQYYKKHNKKIKKEFHVPKWEIETNSNNQTIKETKADLMNILDQTNPDELLMTSLVQQSKLLKSLALKTNTTTEENTTPLVIETAKVTIDLSQTCPICNKLIREIMYALHDYDHDKLAHFDCVYKKVLESVKDKLNNNRYLAYLGSGSFGIMEKQKNNSIILIEKIYPGAPLEEMLHGDDQNQIDEEL